MHISNKRQKVIVNTSLGQAIHAFTCKSLMHCNCIVEEKYSLKTAKSASGKVKAKRRKNVVSVLSDKRHATNDTRFLFNWSTDRIGCKLIAAVHRHADVAFAPLHASHETMLLWWLHRGIEHRKIAMDEDTASEHKMHTAPVLTVKISADNPRPNGWAVCKYLIWERMGEVDKRYDEWRNVTRNDGIRPYCRAVISFIYKWMNSGQLSNSSLDTLNELRSKKSPLTMNTKPIDVELMSAASYKSNRQ